MSHTRKLLTILLIAGLLAVILVWDLNLPAGVIHGIPSDLTFSSPQAPSN